jgi:hypothetical protein
MRHIIVQNLKTLRRGPTKGREDDVVFLHMLLNYHLGPPDDQLPLTGRDATAFGPRTEAKVKKFQEINKIDITDRQFFKDGVVGPHTWAVLTKPFMMTAIVLAAPQLKLTPPSFPNLPIPRPPGKIVIPVPKLTLPPINVQSGAQVTIPFDGSPVTVANALTVTATILKVKDGKVRPEVQVGPTIIDTPSGGTDETDFGFLVQASTGDLPGSGDVVAYSVQTQLAILKSLTDRAGSAQLNPFVEVAVTVLKVRNVATIKITGQGGVVGELDTPGRANNRLWKVKGGGAAFFGLTVTFGEHEDAK